MGLQSTASQGVPKPTKGIQIKTQGASGHPKMYSVPEGKYFEGYIYMSNASTPGPKIDDVEVVHPSINQASTNGRPHLFVLMPGQVVAAGTNTSYYTYIIGAEYDA